MKWQNYCCLTCRLKDDVTNQPFLVWGAHGKLSWWWSHPGHGCPKSFLDCSQSIRLLCLSGVVYAAQRGVCGPPTGGTEQELHKRMAQHIEPPLQVKTQQCTGISRRRDTVLRTVMYTFRTEKNDGLREESRKPSLLNWKCFWLFLLNWKSHLWTEQVVSGFSFPAPTVQHRLPSPGSFTIIRTLDPATETRPFRQVDNSEVMMTLTTCTLMGAQWPSLLISWSSPPSSWELKKPFGWGETSSRSKKKSSCPFSSPYKLSWQTDLPDEI